MTAKQKAARAKFKAIQAEAKKLRKKNPRLTQAEAVKQAWAISYSKKRGTKKVGAASTKVKAHKGKKTNEMHTDTKSHNVNIRVVSGVGVIKSRAFREIELTKKLIHEQTELLEKLKNSYKKSKSKDNKALLMMDIKTLRNSFIPHNKRKLKSLQSALKKSL